MYFSPAAPFDRVAGILEPADPLEVARRPAEGSMGRGWAVRVGTSIRVAQSVSLMNHSFLMLSSL
jgi:hypothetical protein